MLFTSTQVSALETSIVSSEDFVSLDAQSGTLTRTLRKTAGINAPSTVYAYKVIEGVGTYAGYIPHVPFGDSTTHWFYKGVVPFYPGVFIESIIEFQ